MKAVLFLSLFSISLTSLAAGNWNVVGETTDCAEKIKILAKEGEKFVYAVKGDEKTKLVAKDKTPFTSNGPLETIYQSANHTYTFTNPAMVDGNPAKINIAHNGKIEKCSLKTK
jgi:hypothetical protein